MKFIRFEHKGKALMGVLSGTTIHEVCGDMFCEPQKTGRTYELSGVKLLVPCQPQKVFVIGLNYLSHIAEGKHSVPSEPVVLLKAPSALIAHGEQIVVAHPEHETHYEGELAVIIGKRAKRVKRDDAHKHIFGYTCANDVSDRVVQRQDPRWMRAKSFDTYCPLGPVVETDADPRELVLITRQNGETKQHHSCSDMVFDVPTLIEFISAEITLLPGDVILTGTPGGVGPVKPGDVIEVSIDGIGTLKNSVTVA
jgi:2-keto-4-pentenoate hydratase/2-oxohepta-3-ene-1,7-dioic acid hydratase in catechol pathway